MLCRVTFWSYWALESTFESDCNSFSPTTERKDLARELRLHTFMSKLFWPAGRKRVIGATKDFVSLASQR